MARVRGNGEYSIYRYKGKKWRGQVTLGYDVNGKIIRKSATGDTQGDVKAKLKEIEENFNGIDIRSSDYSIEEWSTFWLDTYKKPQLEETSYNGYKRLFKNHINPNLGHFRLMELTTLDIQLAYNKMFQDKDKYSTSTLKAIHNKLKLCLDRAVKDNKIKVNPAIGVELPKVRPAKKVRALTVDEQKKLVERCTKEEYSNIFIFLIATGMRIGETLGLTWDHVDLENKELYIEKTMVEIGGNPRFKNYPKTDSGVRTIHLNDVAYNILKDRKEINNEEFNIHNLVFYSSTYNFRTTANLRRYFDRVQEEAGINRYNLHALRHTYATRMIEKDCNIKFLSVTLGHKDITTTLQIYSDVLSDFKREQTASIDIFS